MSTSAPLQAIAPGLWVMRYPLKTLGVDLQRNVTLIRLNSGRLIIHSTAPFSPQDVAAIRALGDPGWLVDTLLRHDTFAEEGRRAFPHAIYLAPPGFSVNLPFQTGALVRTPEDWRDEVGIVPIEGAPEFGEIVFFHGASRTLIVADLLVNFPGHHGIWTDLLLHFASAGGRHAPCMTLPFRKAVQDRAAFLRSVEAVLALPFDRIIVGHGDPVETDGPDRLREAVRLAGFDLAQPPVARQVKNRPAGGRDQRLEESRNNISPAFGT